MATLAWAAATAVSKSAASYAAAESATAIFNWTLTHRTRKTEGSAEEKSASSPVADLCMELDLDASVQTVEALLKTVEARGPQHQNEAVRVAVRNVEECLNEIRVLGSAIDEKLDAFEECWFQSWRSPGIDDELARLRHFGTVITKRVDMLIQMMAIPAAPAAIASAAGVATSGGAGGSSRPVASTIAGRSLGGGGGGGGSRRGSGGGSGGSGGNGGGAAGGGGGGGPKSGPRGIELGYVFPEVPTGQVLGIVPSSSSSSATRQPQRYQQMQRSSPAATIAVSSTKRGTNLLTYS